MTGWAQVNGRNAIGWDDKLEMDVWYVENWSFGLDLKILAATLRSVVRPRRHCRRRVGDDARVHGLAGPERPPPVRPLIQRRPG